MKIRNYTDPPVGNSADERCVIRITYRAFRKAGHSSLASRALLRAMFAMGEVRGAAKVRNSWRTITQGEY